MKKENPSFRSPGGIRQGTLSPDPGKTGIVCPAARSEKEFEKHIKRLNSSYKRLEGKTS